ncbi:MAG: DinB family protein [Dehalococcoidia bacterium]
MDHRDVARNGLDETLSVLKSTIDGLTPVELYWQPAPNSNHIAWTVWHMSRAEDHWYNRYIGQGEPVWTSGEYFTKLGLREGSSGFGDSAEIVAKFPALDIAEILEYSDAVRTESLKNLDLVTATQLSETRDGVRGDPPTIAWVLGHVLVEQAQHLGQIAYIRGILRGLGN